jgi:hypothetical protein
MPEAKAKKKEPDVLVAEVIDRRPTGFTLEGTGEKGIPAVVMDTSYARKLKRESAVLVLMPDPNDLKGPKIWQIRRIRYIKGCPTIWMDEQEAKKIVPRNPAQDAIWLEKGVLSALREGADSALYQYVMLYEGNKDFPETDKLRRMPNAIDLYSLIDTEATAEDQMTDFDVQLEALNFLSKLRIKKSETEYLYKEDALEFLAALFQLPSYPSGYKAEAFVALTDFAKREPQKFLAEISSQKSAVETDVAKGLHYKVIEIDDARAFFIEGGKKIMDLQSASGEGKIDDVVNFMANPKNTAVYGLMRNLIQIAQSKELAKN